VGIVFPKHPAATVVADAHLGGATNDVRGAVFKGSGSGAERDAHNTRHLGELKRLAAAEAGQGGQKERSRQVFARLRRRSAS
jgi:hypothetical protein